MWASTPKRRVIPLDLEPVLGGNIILVGPGIAEFLSRTAVLEMRESGDRAYQSHFVTCPQANEHRRR